MRHGHAERLRYMEVNMPCTCPEGISACPVFCSRGHPALVRGSVRDLLPQSCPEWRPGARNGGLRARNGFRTGEPVMRNDIFSVRQRHIQCTRREIFSVDAKTYSARMQRFILKNSINLSKGACRFKKTTYICNRNQGKPPSNEQLVR